MSNVLPRLIRELLARDMSETEIVDELRAMGVRITQPTLNRIKTGVQKSTSFDIGTGLTRLHNRLCAPLHPQ